MKTSDRAIAIVGVGAVLPDAPNPSAFWQNLVASRYSISDVPKERWDPDLYYDADPKAPDKTYSRIGGWATDWEWNPLQWRLPIPPKVSDAMDPAQKWAIICARQALEDFGYPDRPLDKERTAVILGNALGGDYHLLSSARVLFPEIGEELSKAPSFLALPTVVRAAVMEEVLQGVRARLPDITEDTMPGELANIVAGRVAAIFDFKGPNYIADAACASAMAAISAAVEGLEQGDYDAVLTGGIDTNMNAAAFVKFCKIGALSATGTRPYAEGADGFVMGEGAACFLLKRLADAERDGDKVYAVIRGIGGSSDGRGKGITAPNPVGQQLAIRRAWERAGLRPEAGDLIEGHGTSTKVGDVVEVESLAEVFKGFGLPVGSLALGSVKSNIGHLKGAAGAAGILKSALALHEKVIPPSLNFDAPNPNIDFSRFPLAVANELKPWEKRGNGEIVRRAGISAFGFGGTNFHAVLEEYVPGRLGRGSVTIQGAEVASMPPATSSGELKAPLRGALVIGGDDLPTIASRLREVHERAARGSAPEPAPPHLADLRAPHRLAIDYGDAEELADLAARALTALESDDDGRWRALRNKGVFLGSGAPGKVAFLFTGQGAQYVNMLRELRAREPIVAEVFEEADRIMTPLLGGPLTDRIFVDEGDADAAAVAEEGLKQTAITQPAVLTVDASLSRLLSAYGIAPDMVMGHSLGEYGALVQAGAMPLKDALTAVSARGKAMTDLAVEDNGLMAAVFGPVERVESILEQVDGYVVIANLNSGKECVIGGATDAVRSAIEKLSAEGLRVTQLPVSHAFHTKIVEPAAGPLKDVLRSLALRPPTVPVVANVNGDFYPSHEGAEPEMIEILGRQIGSPVQFVKGLETLYDAGARIFVEMGPRRVLYTLVGQVLGDREDVRTFFTNHPRTGDIVSVNRALCGLYAEGLGAGAEAPVAVRSEAVPVAAVSAAPAPPIATPPAPAATGSPSVAAPSEADRYVTLGRMFAEFMDRSFEVYTGTRAAPAPVRIGVTGASLGLPGLERVFDEGALPRILAGEVFIGSLSDEGRRAQVDRRITRLVKGSNGEARFEAIDDPDDVIKLAGRGGALDLAREFGYPDDRLEALDRTTRLAIAAGIEALKDAGIPLVRRYKTTTTGSTLPSGWALPEEYRDDTAIIFGSAFPGYDHLVRTLDAFHADKSRRDRLDELRAVAEALRAASVDVPADLAGRIQALEAALEKEPFSFDRRFLFQVLSMGHSQFAEYIGARGPNIGTNAACASGTQAVALAHDWIQTGRCRRVIVLTADDITTDALFPWFGSGFLSSGAAATDAQVEDAAVPFDRRRHGMLVGMGGAALVIEDLGAAADRGLHPICEVLGTVTANSAFHGTRLDVEHISRVMEDLVTDVEQRWSLDRQAIAAETVFVSHETYTPARGGSASAEVHALRTVFGAAADRIVIANTKGYTGHPMAVAMEDVLAVKMLETGIVPPVANFKEVDPELGVLNLSRGGSHPVCYALRLAAGFGSQISMSLVRWAPPPDGARRRPEDVGYQHRIADANAWQSWLRRVTGYPAPQLEIVDRMLRITDQGPPAAAPRPAASDRASSAAAAAPVAAPPAAAADVQRAAVSASPAPAPEVSAPPAMGGASGAEPVRDRVLAIVSEQTGYPPDMLALDLDLEADLGIDTVKQAEMFVAIREEYGIERDENLALRDYATLGRAIEFVYEKRPDLRPSAASLGTSPSVAPAAGPSRGETASSLPVPETDPVRERVLAIVAEQTGYPPDMLALDLDLEADLGIDTVKQAEMFVAIREEYGIERDENLALRDYPTLARAIEFVYEKRPDLKPSSTAPSSVAPPPAPEVPTPPETTSQRPVTEGDAVRERVLAIVSEQTGYPSDMLDLDLDLEADLGIDTVKQAEMFVAIREEYGIERDENLALRDYPTLARAIEFVYEKRPDLRPSAATAAASTPGAPEAPPPVDAVPAPATGSETDPVRERVLAIVAEQTGYPPDMLDLDLDLEADLGIDTVKQAEMFVAIRGEYGIERDENLALRDYPTLARAIEFVYEKRPDLRAGGAPIPAPTASEPTPPEPASSHTEAVRGSMDAAQAIPRRVPRPQLRPAADRFVGTGVALDAGTRVVLAPDAGGVARALADRLAKMGVEVLIADLTLGDEDYLAQLERWKADGPLHGVYWLPALDVADQATLARATDRRELLRQRVKLLHATMRCLYDHVGRPGTFLVSGTRLGGQHGYDAEGATDVVGGAVSGFTKAFGRERPEGVAKVVDFAPSRKTAALADLFMVETLHDPAVMEIGYTEEGRWTVALSEEPIEVTGALPENGVYVVTGAAGSIVSAIVRDLAAQGPGTFWLLDLAPEPDPQDSDLERLTSDREGLKRDIFTRLQEKGAKATPVVVERELARLERAHAAASAMEAVRSAGGTAHYRSVNLTDPAAVAQVMAEVVADAGRVDVLLHAAGLEISRSLPDKSADEFALVFDVKAEGWFNVMAGLGDVPLGAAVVFSSIAGRFGNAGQTDYSAANDLLCKAVSAFRNARSETRGVALDWTAWRDIGMASRGSIPTIMEHAGIEMLPPEAGIPVTRRELSIGTSGEVVVAGTLGVMLEEPAERVTFGATPAGPMMGAACSFGVHRGLVVEVDLDPTRQPFLDHHRIDGTAVLPGVMGMEAMAEAARAGFPELHVTALEDVDFLTPFKFYRDEPRTVTVRVQYARDGDDVIARCVLEGSRTLHGRDDAEVTRHFKGSIRLRARPPEEERSREIRAAAEGEGVLAEAVYRVFFHGPAYRVVGRAQRVNGEVTGWFAEGLPPNHEPPELPTLVAPRMIELAFQTAGLAEIADQARLGLPLHVQRLELFEPDGLDRAGSAAVATPMSDGSYHVDVADSDGRVRLAIHGYRTVALPGSIDVAALDALR